MTTLDVERMTVAVHLPDGDPGGRERVHDVDRVLRRVAGESLAHRLSSAGLPTYGEWCVRRVTTTLTWVEDASAGRLEADWLGCDPCAASPGAQAGESGAPTASPGVVHYRHRDEAVLDLVGVAGGATLGLGVAFSRRPQRTTASSFSWCWAAPAPDAARRAAGRRRSRRRPTAPAARCRWLDRAGPPGGGGLRWRARRGPRLTSAGEKGGDGAIGVPRRGFAAPSCRTLRSSGRSPVGGPGGPAHCARLGGARPAGRRPGRSGAGRRCAAGLLTDQLGGLGPRLGEGAEPTHSLAAPGTAGPRPRELATGLTAPHARPERPRSTKPWQAVDASPGPRSRAASPPGSTRSPPMIAPVAHTTAWGGLPFLLGAADAAGLPELLDDARLRSGHPLGRAPPGRRGRRRRAGGPRAARPVRAPAVGPAGPRAPSPPTTSRPRWTRSGWRGGRRPTRRATTSLAYGGDRALLRRVVRTPRYAASPGGWTSCSGWRRSTSTSGSPASTSTRAGCPGWAPS